MKTVRILGTARNSRALPADLPPDCELWLANNPTTIKVRCPRALGMWTRWFNLHSRKHMEGTYPAGFHMYKTAANGRPIYLLKAQPDIPTSVAFPREQIQEFFKTPSGKPNRYFTCSVCWLIAFAVMEGFERIELWGFELRDTKPGQAYAHERPCVAYWIDQAHTRGVQIAYQDELRKLYEAGKMVPGDPDTYTGPLYGYSTKPEPDWDKETDSWKSVSEE